MDNNALIKAIEKTKAEIYKVKCQIEKTTDYKEKSRLQSRLKELQYLQLWQLDQCGWWTANKPGTIKESLKT